MRFSGQISELEIIEPSDTAFHFFQGESRNLTYKLRNSGIHPIKDVAINAITVVKVGLDEKGKRITRPTEYNYAKVIQLPANIPAKKTKDMIINVSVPMDYNERIQYKGKMELQTMRVELIVKSIKHITEI